MNGVGAFQAANSIPGDLVTTMLQGQQQQTELAMKAAQVNAEMNMQQQQQAQAMGLVAAMTGVGTQVDTMA